MYEALVSIFPELNELLDNAK